MIQDLINWVQELGPLGLFTFLVLGSFGLPIAKSLLLLLAGMLAHQSGHGISPYLAAAVLGLHFGDFSLYLIGRILDEKLFELPLVRKIFPQKSVLKAKKLVEERGVYSLVIAKLTPYIRGALYLSLGSLKMNAWKFSGINILVCFVYALFFFLPGFFLVDQLENLKKFSKYGNSILTILLILILAGLYIRWKTKKKTQEKSP